MGLGQGGCSAQQCPSPKPVPPLAHLQAGATAPLPRVERVGHRAEAGSAGQETAAAGPAAEGAMQRTWARGTPPPSWVSRLPRGPGGGGRCCLSGSRAHLRNTPRVGAVLGTEPERHERGAVFRRGPGLVGADRHQTKCPTNRATEERQMQPRRDVGRSGASRGVPPWGWLSEKGEFQQRSEGG